VGHALHPEDETPARAGTKPLLKKLKNGRVGSLLNDLTRWPSGYAEKTSDSSIGSIQVSYLESHRERRITRQHDDAANPRQRRDGIDLTAIPMPVQTLGPVLELCGRQKFDVPGNILTQQALVSTVPALRTWRPVQELICTSAFLSVPSARHSTLYRLRPTTCRSEHNLGKYWSTA
jgi:hypothetical protein